MLIRELFDQAYNLRWINDQARFVTDDHSEVRVSFHDMSLSSAQMLEITFSRRSGQRTGTMHVTGQGDAGKIFATVFQAIEIYLSQNPAEYIYFTADESSRQKLYAHMVSRLTRTGAYHRVTAHEYQQLGNDELPFSDDNHIFLLKRNN